MGERGHDRQRRDLQQDVAPAHRISSHCTMRTVSSRDWGKIVQFKRY
jgi:hypothetical protein